MDALRVTHNSVISIWHFAQYDWELTDRNVPQNSDSVSQDHIIKWATDNSALRCIRETVPSGMDIGVQNMDFVIY